MAKQGAKKAAGTKKSPASPISVKNAGKNKVRPPRPAAKPLAKSRRVVNEPPPKDHALVLAPLFLAAGHGFLTRPVDASWKSALKKYRDAFSDAVDYERRRSPEARLAFVLLQHPKLRMMIGNLTQRSQNDKTHTKDLVSELQAFGDLLGGLGALLRGIKFDAPHQSAQLTQTQIQLQNEYARQVARAADLQRQA